MQPKRSAICLRISHLPALKNRRSFFFPSRLVSGVRLSLDQQKADHHRTVRVDLFPGSKGRIATTITEGRPGLLPPFTKLKLAGDGGLACRSGEIVNRNDKDGYDITQSKPRGRIISFYIVGSNMLSLPSLHPG